MFRTDEAEEAEAFLFNEEIDKKSLEMANRDVIAAWNYESDINEVNQQFKLEQSLISARFQKLKWENVTRFNWRSFQNEDLKRQYRFMSVLGPAALPEEQYTKVSIQGITYIINYQSFTSCCHTSYCIGSLELQDQVICMNKFCFFYSSLKQEIACKRFTVRPRFVLSIPHSIAV